MTQKETVRNIIPALLRNGWNKIVIYEEIRYTNDKISIADFWLPWI